MNISYYTMEAARMVPTPFCTKEKSEAQRMTEACSKSHRTHLPMGTLYDVKNGDSKPAGEKQDLGYFQPL